MTSRIEIPFSNGKIAFLFTAGTAFVVLGVLFILQPELFVSPIFRSPVFIRIFGMIDAAFFGIGLAVIAKKLFGNKSALIIDREGIIDNTNMIEVGLIEWDDISGIKTARFLLSTSFILQTDKPEKYIGRAKNGFIRFVMKTNQRLFGSPLSVSPNSLKIKFEDVEKLLTTEFEKRDKKIVLNVKC